MILSHLIEMKQESSASNSQRRHWHPPMLIKARLVSVEHSYTRLLKGSRLQFLLRHLAPFALWTFAKKCHWRLLLVLLSLEEQAKRWLWKMSRWVKWIVQIMHTSAWIVLNSGIKRKAPDKVCHNNQTQTGADAYIDTYRYRYRYRYEQCTHRGRCRNHGMHFQSYSERARSVNLIPVHHHEYDR